MESGGEAGSMQGVRDRKGSERMGEGSHGAEMVEGAWRKELMGGGRSKLRFVRTVGSMVDKRDYHPPEL
eukprot:758321-Hanusia_phi.AAC.2